MNTASRRLRVEGWLPQSGSGFGARPAQAGPSRSTLTAAGACASAGSLWTFNPLRVETTRAPSFRQHARECRHPGAFTLIEIMVVVGIMGMIMAMGVPTLYNMLHREGFSKTVVGVMELCSAARAQAILHGTTTEVVFNLRDRRCELGAGVEAGGRQSGAPKSSLAPVTFGDDLSIEMLDVNLLEYKDSPAAHVRFFPNGTSDEMTLILRSGSEWRKISLEITTGLASLDSDPHHWR